jgi:leucyl aminopeptidase
VGLRGSQDIAEASTGVVAVLQYDMTALNSSVQDFGVLSDFTDPQLTAFVFDLITTYLPELSAISTACGYGCSDHAAWHAEGIPVAMAFESRFGQHNGAIHTPSDTLATLGNSAEHALKFARLASAFMVELGSGELSALFVDGFESGTRDAWSATHP